MKFSGLVIVRTPHFELGARYLNKVYPGHIAISEPMQMRSGPRIIPYSHILTRPELWRVSPFVYLAKQCGVPVRLLELLVHEDVGNGPFSVVIPEEWEVEHEYKSLSKHMMEKFLGQADVSM